eukprot:5351754-Prymnesium_polylepis.1
MRKICSSVSCTSSESISKWCAPLRLYASSETIPLRPSPLIVKIIWTRRAGACHILGEGHACVVRLGWKAGDRAWRAGAGRAACERASCEKASCERAS